MNQIHKLPQRIIDKISINGKTDCWEWIACIDRGGYARIQYQGKFASAHRIVYQLLCGEIHNETLDHLCRVRHCVNPDHLEAVSNKKNCLRGNGPTAKNARKTHCKRGHPLSGSNLALWKSGGRRCKTCMNDRKQARRRAGCGY